MKGFFHIKMFCIEFSLEPAVLPTAALTYSSPMCCSSDLNMLIRHSFSRFYYCSVQFPAQLPSFPGRPDSLSQQPGPDEDWGDMMGICRTMIHIVLSLNYEESYLMNVFMCNPYCPVWVDLHKGPHTKCHGDSAATLRWSRAMFSGNSEAKRLRWQEMMADVCSQEGRPKGYCSLEVCAWKRS